MGIGGISGVGGIVGLVAIGGIGGRGGRGADELSGKDDGTGGKVGGQPVGGGQPELGTVDGIPFNATGGMEAG